MAAYRATVSGLPTAEVLNPSGRIVLTQVETYRHIDRTTARKVYVQDPAPFNMCADDLAMIESDIDDAKISSLPERFLVDPSVRRMVDEIERRAARPVPLPVLPRGSWT